MKIKQKQLGIISYLLHQPISKQFDSKRIFAYAKAAQEVKNKIEALQTTELNVGRKYINDFNGVFKKEQQKEFEAWKKEMEAIYEEEIEIPDLPKFRLSEWKELELTSFQIAELIEIGIIIGE